MAEEHAVRHCEIEPLHREWAAESVPILSADLALPAKFNAEKSKATLRIARYYRSLGRAFWRDCEKTLVPALKTAADNALCVGAMPACRYISLTAQICFDRDHILSLLLLHRETGGADALLFRRADTWDLSRGCPLPLRTFFPPRTAIRRRILAAAPPDFRGRIRSDCFYLSNDALHLFDPQGAWDFSLPYDSESGAVLPCSGLPCIKGENTL